MGGDNNNSVAATAVTSLPGWCADPALTQILSGSGPYPMVVMPAGGGYWIDGDSKSDNVPRLEPTTPRCPRVGGVGDSPEHYVTLQVAPASKYQLEVDETSKSYRKHFLGRVRICDASYLNSIFTV